MPGTSACSEASPNRSEMVTRGLRLEYLTVGWNIVEGLVSELDEGETLLLAATMTAPGTAEALRARGRGSRVLRIPPALFPRDGAIT